MTKTYAFFSYSLRTLGIIMRSVTGLSGCFSTHTARFLLNDCDGLIFCTIFADDGDDKA